MKDQFKRLVQKNNLEDRVDVDFEESPEKESDFSGLSTNARLVDRGGRTNQKYLCRAVPCDGCGEPVLYVLEPEYHIVVGEEHSLPLELCWTECKWEASGSDEIDDGRDESHGLVSSDFALVTCSACEETTPFRFGVDGGLCIAVSKYERTHVRIPKSRLPYRSSPEDDWVVEHI